MRNFRITALTFMLIAIFSSDLAAQQDAQFTQYMYNTLSLNPAYAGSREVLSFVGLYRSQWVGLDGAPKTQSFSVHSPVGNNVSLGLNVVNDNIFITNETYIDIDFSYTIQTSQSAKINLGLKAGAHLLDVDSNRAFTGSFNQGDVNSEINIDNKFSPQLGFGAFYFTNKFYAGLSAPNLLATKHFDNSNNSNLTSVELSKERIHYYFITGYVFDLGSELLFKPSILAKAVAGTPLQIDASANFLLFEKLTLGAAYRWNAAVSGLVGFQITDQIMLGFAYDRETTELQQYNNGSYEVFLRYEVFKRNKRMLSPRFF